MNVYEVIFILDPVLTEEGVEAEIGAAGQVVGKSGGEVLETQRWGKKRLAYEVKKRRDGQYIMMKVGGPARVVAELGRHFRITETVLKGIVVRAERPRKTRFKARSHASFGGVATAAQEVDDG